MHNQKQKSFIGLEGEIARNAGGEVAAIGES